MAPDAPTPAEREHELVNGFWQQVRIGGDRLELLKEYAAYTIERPADWDFTGARLEPHGGTATLAAEECFGCRHRDQKLYWHHVIPIGHGGSNSLRNRVPLCLRCHHRIHPWLPETRKGEQLGGEWWSLSDILEDVKQRQDQTSDVIEDAQSTQKTEKPR